MIRCPSNPHDFSPQVSYFLCIWSDSITLKGVTIFVLLDMGYWFELIGMFLSWIWLTTVQSFSDVLIWTRIFIPGFIFFIYPMKLKTKQGCCLIRAVQKLRWQDFGFFWPPTPLCWHFLWYEHWQTVDIFEPPTYLVL